MEVTFINPGVDYMIQSIMHFQAEGEAEFWSEPLYHFYPQLDKAYAISLPVAERKDYIERTMRAAYAELEDTISEKVTLFINSLWNKHGGGVPHETSIHPASLHFHSVGSILSYRLLEGRTA